MEWLTTIFAEQSVAWLLLSTITAIVSGFVASWLTYRFVKRREIIETVQAEVHKERELQEMKGKVEQADRIRKEIVRWANPILFSVKDLENRLDNILTQAGYLALGPNYQEEINPNWAVSHEYFMNSTLFIFGQYFAYVQMLQEELSFEMFQSQEHQKEFFDAVNQVGKTLADFPPSYNCTGRDTQLFKLQQRALGEICIVREKESRRCISYPEFLKNLSLPEFQQHLKPLVTLLEKLTPTDDCRWKRLSSTQKELSNLRVVCKRLLSLESRGQS